MRRTSLSRKLLLAALPLLAAVGVLLAITVRNDLDRVEDAQRDADLGRVWSHLVDAVAAIGHEQQVAIDGVAGRSALTAAPAAGTADADAYDQVTTTTDAALGALTAELGAHPEFGAMQLGQTQPALDVARRLTRQWAQDNSVATAAVNTPFRNYAVALREMETVSSLLQAATGNPASARSLLGVAQFNKAAVAGALYSQAVAQFELDPANTGHLIDGRAALTDAATAYDQFEATATAEWAARFRQAGTNARISTPRSHLTQALQGDAEAIDPVDDLQRVGSAADDTLVLQHQLIDEVVEWANDDAASIRRSTQVRLGVIGAVVLAAFALAFMITRSITRRVRAVARSANAVASEQLPALVEAIRDPRGRALPEVEEVAVKGGDEVAELAGSFNSLQHTLRDVAEEQVAVLRRGVSDIFVTMARRNRSLVDRQLALLDEFEAEVEDPDVLSSYYQIDHLATRMRRNSESLLVLANAEARRSRVGPTEVDTVVRAAVGEIEDYRRIQVEDVDQMKIKGAAVADLAHLVAELLDNATAFSPPDSFVRVGGRRMEDSYLLRIADTGVGITGGRLDELNDLLVNPPIVGLSVEPTLGVSVVSLLAHKHGIEVTMISTPPGLTVDVVIPEALFADAPARKPLPDASDASGDETSQGPAELEAVADLGLSIDPNFAASVTGMTPVNGSAPAAARAADDAVIAELEAGWGSESDNPGPAAAPAEPTIDSAFAARLNDAFERADLGSTGTRADHDRDAATPFDMPVRSRTDVAPAGGFALPGRDRPAGPAGIPTADVPTEQPLAPARATTASSAFASFQAGARAASAELAAGLAAESGTVDLPATEPPATEPELTGIGVEPLPGLAAPTGPAALGLAPPLGVAPAAEPAPASFNSPVAELAPALPTRGEFSVPPAPPVGPSGPSGQPVAPAHATPAPRPAAPITSAPDLPSRSRPSTSEPTGSTGNGTGAEAEGLAAALAAFDSASYGSGTAHGPAASPAEPALTLPSRNRGDEHYTGTYREDGEERPESIASSALNPEQLRARLRAFQSEFREGQQTLDTHNDRPVGEDH